MTGRDHALLVLKSFLSCHIQLCIFSENHPGECTIKACLSLPAYPGHASGRMGAGYSGLSCQVDSSRQVEDRLRGLDQAFRNPNGHSKHNGFYCLEVVPQRHHPDQPLPFLLFLTITSLADTGSGRLSSSKLLIACLVSTDIGLSKFCPVVYFFFYLYPLVIFIEKYNVKIKFFFFFKWCKWRTFKPFCEQFLKAHIFLSVKDILSEDFLYFFHCKEPFVQWKGPSWNHCFLTENNVWGTVLENLIAKHVDLSQSFFEGRCRLLA